MLSHNKISNQADTVDYDQGHGVGQQAKTLPGITGPGTANTAGDKDRVQRHHWNVGHSGRKHNGTDYTTGPGHDFCTKPYTI